MKQSGNYRIAGEAGFTGFILIASFLAMTNALYVNALVLMKLSKKNASPPQLSTLNSLVPF
jgi:hypothetical protein